MGDREDESKQERLFRRVAKIPISLTFNVLEGVDFVDYGDGWVVGGLLIHLQGAPIRYYTIAFTGDKKDGMGNRG